MAYPVYSTRFILAPSLAAPVTYTVPAGLRAVLRDASCLLTAAGAVALYFGINGVYVWASAPAANGVNESPHWTGRVILNPGDVLELGATQAVGGQASGYLLSLP